MSATQGPTVAGRTPAVYIVFGLLHGLEIISPISLITPIALITPLTLDYSTSPTLAILPPSISREGKISYTRLRLHVTIYTYRDGSTRHEAWQWPFLLHNFTYMRTMFLPLVSDTRGLVRGQLAMV